MLWHHLGILGLLGAALIFVWLIGFTVFGLHDGLWHLLAPVGLLLLVVQLVRQVAHDEP